MASLTEPTPAGPVVAGLAAGVGVALCLVVARPAAGVTPVERVISRCSPDAQRICGGDARAKLASHLSGPCGDPDRSWLVDGPVDARELAVLVDAATDRPATIGRSHERAALVLLDDRGS